MTGGMWVDVVRAEVGPQLAAHGAHYGACRTAPDGTRSVSWWFPPGARRRERRLVFRALGGRLDEWEVEYAELAAADRGHATLVHASRSRRAGRDELGRAVDDLLATGLPRRGRTVVVDDGYGARVRPPGSTTARCRARVRCRRPRRRVVPHRRRGASGWPTACSAWSWRSRC